MQTEYLVMAHGREESVQKARMSLVTNKRVSTGSNSQLERAVRQDGGAVLLPLKSPRAHILLSAFRLRATATMQYRRSLCRVQHTNPGLACPPDKAQIEVLSSPGGSTNVSRRWCQQGPSDAPASPLLPSRLPLRPLSSSVHAASRTQLFFTHSTLSLRDCSLPNRQN